MLISQAEDYKGSFDDIFKRKGMPREPSFYVNVPSRMLVRKEATLAPIALTSDRDETAAPEGKDALVVLIPVGHLLPTSKPGETIKTFSNGSAVPDVDSQDWNALVERARSQVIETMETRLGIRGLRDMIAWEGLNTPETCERRQAVGCSTTS